LKKTVNIVSNKDHCPVCGSKMIEIGFDGDWLVTECSDNACQTQIESPVGNPDDGDGFTMESLKMASDYADE
jgi:hypothetical protein